MSHSRLFILNKGNLILFNTTAKNITEKFINNFISQGNMQNNPHKPLFLVIMRILIKTFRIRIFYYRN